MCCLHVGSIGVPEANFAGEVSFKADIWAHVVILCGSSLLCIETEIHQPKVTVKLFLCKKKQQIQTMCSCLKCSIIIPYSRVPAEFECALGSCLRCAFTLHVPSLVTSRMWRLIFNVICESLSTRTYANCTSELQVSGCTGDAVKCLFWPSVFKIMEEWEMFSFVLKLRLWESCGESKRVLMVGRGEREGIWSLRWLWSKYVGGGVLWRLCTQGRVRWRWEDKKFMY